MLFKFKLIQCLNYNFQWCYEGECLTIGERLSTSVSFGPWSKWTPCSRTCGSGVASSTRNCNHATSKSSEYCRGNSVRHKICATEVPINLIISKNLIYFLNYFNNAHFIAFHYHKFIFLMFFLSKIKVKYINFFIYLLFPVGQKPCEIGSPSFRDVQCSEFNDWIFPEDGKVHQWVGYNLPESK